MADDLRTPPDTPTDDQIIQAMVQALEESLTHEGAIRDLLAKAGFDDPDLPVEECVSSLVQAYLRVAAPS